MNPRIFKECSCPERYKYPRKRIPHQGTRYETVIMNEEQNDRIAMIRFWVETANMGIFDLTQTRTFESGLGGDEARFPYIGTNNDDTEDILDDFSSNQYRNHCLQKTPHPLDGCGIIFAVLFPATSTCKIAGKSPRSPRPKAGQDRIETERPSFPLRFGPFFQTRRV